MSISYRELLHGISVSDISIEHQHNGEDLLIKINKIREAYGKPMTVTSGFRRLSDHIRIYSELAHKRGIPFDQAKVPMGSSHLSFMAVDIADPDGDLYDWCQNNVSILEQVGLWCEAKDDQARVHFQITPPKSGKRFFSA
jgi:hypothetical protein